MEQTSAPPVSIAETLDRLARFEPVPHPVVSLYLDTRPDQRGRDHFWPFVRKELAARARTYAPRSPEREGFDRDAERIERYLLEDLRPSANGVALFACSGADGFFEALQLDAPIEENRLAVGDCPHLYPLARLIDEHPRYAVLVADTRSARLYVFGRGRTIESDTIESEVPGRTSVRGWSQMRYQRHVDALQARHAKEVVEALERTVREDRVRHVLLAGDEVIVPLLRDQLPKALEEMVVDTLRLEMRAPEHAIAQAAALALKEHDARTDRERVERLLDEYRSGGLGVVGPEETLAALSVGQVDELLLSSTLDPAGGEGPPSGATGGPNASDAHAPESHGETERTGENLANELVRLAHQTAARVRFIQDPSLMAELGGVGAMLRYRLEGTGLEKNP